MRIPFWPKKVVPQPIDAPQEPKNDPQSAKIISISNPVNDLLETIRLENTREAGEGADSYPDV